MKILYLKMGKTKQSIIEGSIRLFNIHGYSNVSLQQIARELGLSAGNLTYHFPKKEDLMEEIYDYFVAELNKITSGYKSFVDLKGIDLQLRGFYSFQQRFKFFYLDLLEFERDNPSLATRHYRHIEKQIEGIFSTLIYNVGLAKLAGYESTEYYQYLARQMWMTIVFWSVQMSVRGMNGGVDEMLDAVWIQIKPHMTPAGLIDFNNFHRTLKSVS